MKKSFQKPSPIQPPSPPPMSPQLNMQELEFKDNVNTIIFVGKKCFNQCLFNFESFVPTDDEKKCYEDCARLNFASLTKTGDNFEKINRKYNKI